MTTLAMSNVYDNNSIYFAIWGMCSSYHVLLTVYSVMCAFVTPMRELPYFYRQVSSMAAECTDADDSDDESHYELKRQMVLCHSEQTLSICSGATKRAGEIWELDSEGQAFDKHLEWILMVAIGFNLWTKTSVFFDLNGLLVKHYGLDHSPFVRNYIWVSWYVLVKFGGLWIK